MHFETHPPAPLPHGVLNLVEAQSLAAEAMATGHWCVLRNGGRGMKLRYKSRSEVCARSKFRKVKETMRQGCVILLSPDGTLHGYASEPMCRTRW